MDRHRRKVRSLTAGAAAVAIVFAAGCGNDDGGDKVTEALNGALLAHVQGRLNQAMTDYEAVLKLDDKNVDALYGLGLVEQNTGRADDALARYQEVLKLDAKYEPALVSSALIRANKGEANDAITLLRQAIGLNADDAVAHLNLGLLLKKVGQDVEGDAEIAKAGQLSPALAPASTTTTTPASTTTTRKK
jgi:tetratricopeptide (TPR) repeat protein